MVRTDGTAGQLFLCLFVIWSPPYIIRRYKSFLKQFLFFIESTQGWTLTLSKMNFSYTWLHCTIRYICHLHQVKDPSFELYFRLLSWNVNLLATSGLNDKNYELAYLTLRILAAIIGVLGDLVERDSDCSCASADFRFCNDLVEIVRKCNVHMGHSMLCSW